MSDYTYDMLVALKDQIEKITDQDILQTIDQIIIKHNKNIASTTTPNGKYLKFNNLSNITYTEIEMYLKKMKKKPSKTNNKNFKTFDTSEDLSDSPKYSNTDKNLIKRQNYIDSITKDNNT